MSPSFQLNPDGCVLNFLPFSRNTKACSNINNKELLNIIIQAKEFPEGQSRSSKLD